MVIIKKMIALFVAAMLLSGFSVNDNNPLNVEKTKLENHQYSPIKTGVKIARETDENGMTHVIGVRCILSESNQCYYLVFSEQCNNGECKRTELERFNLEEGNKHQFNSLPEEFSICHNGEKTIDINDCEIRRKSPFKLQTRTGSKSARQSADLNFEPNVTPALYIANQGPVVAIDSSHDNFHTLADRFAPFGKLLTNDGYQVIDHPKSISAQSLAKVNVLIIANARLTPEAISTDEISVIRTWVEKGGSLFLITDHSPFVEAAVGLAKAFDFELLIKTPRDPQGSVFIVYKQEDLSMSSHAITTSPYINHFRTAAGSVMHIPAEAAPIWTLPKGSFVKEGATKYDVSGLSQGAVRKWGQGKVAIFNEASGFSSQTSVRGDKMGMNHAEAEHNAQFTLNLIHWLSNFSHEKQKDGLASLN